MILKLIEKQYYFELEWKDRLYQQANYTSVFGIAYFSGAAKIILDAQSVPEFNFFPWAISIISAAAGIFFVVRFFQFFGNEYYYVSEPNDLVEVYKGSVDFDQEHPARKIGRKLFYSDLTSSMARCASKNQEVNMRKARCLLDSNRAIFLAIILGAIAYVLYHLG
ncbi:hypothetical protein [Alteriqipengyuania sp. 357]